MKNVYEVLREKEMLLARLRIEVDALRVVVPLLADRTEAGDDRLPDQPSRLWEPALPKNKWPLKVGNPVPSYLES
ncbi:MAG: hypothetical protein ABSA29_02210 [Terriglobales bacterium]|jgi:hypothetical protein